MTCEECTLLLSARMDGELSEEGNKALEDHLASCQECRALSAQLDQLRGAFADLEELPAPEELSRRVMAEIAAPKVVPLFRRPLFRAAVGLAACLVLCVGLLGSGLLPGSADQAVPFAVREESPSAQTEARTAGEEERVPCLVLERLPEGEALSGLDWEEEDGCLVARVDRETLESVMALAEAQGIAARLQGELTGDGSACIRISKQ